MATSMAWVLGLQFKRQVDRSPKSGWVVVKSVEGLAEGGNPYYPGKRTETSRQLVFIIWPHIANDSNEIMTQDRWRTSVVRRKLERQAHGYLRKICSQPSTNLEEQMQMAQGAQKLVLSLELLKLGQTSAAQHPLTDESDWLLAGTDRKAAAHPFHHMQERVPLGLGTPDEADHGDQ
ncbi:hypothetical protein BJV74DRAFT_797902 [Russula compacta]|nr:hypothetical protein BJV74DRAFT_797902 [Russula compacta]